VAAAFASCAGAGCGGAGTSDRVTGVIDGDTVELERLGRVRLIGVDTPERGRCYEDAATRFTRDRLLDEVVAYELGEDRTDRYDRTLAYLSRDGEMHNLALLRGGYAQVLTIPPNDKYEQRFEAAERAARSEEAGRWDRCDRRRIAARRAAAERERERALARHRAALERRLARRAARERRARAARRQESEAGRSYDLGGGGGSSRGDERCLPQSACPGRRDGDGDGCYCE
jgi:micrococcal nuclease